METTIRIPPIPGTRLGLPFEGSGERALGFRASGLGLKAYGV